MAKNNRMKSLGCGMSALILALACGPLGEDGIGIPPISTTGDDEEDTSSTTTDGGDSGGSASGGAATSCASQAPPQTYLCAGNAYEHESAGAAALQLNTERASYACNADEYWYYYYPYYPYEDYGYDEYYTSSGGATPVGAGGAIVGDGDGDGDGDGSGGFGMGGVGMGGQVGSGGTWGSGGNWGAGGGIINPPDLLSDWCEDLDADDMVTGASFAVGECQLTDLALPIKITEPQYGAYEVTVYGGESACDRGVVLAKTAGIGTGVPINIPVDPSGYAYVSVEMTSEQNWEGLELRLVDRPAVGDAPSE